MLLLLDLGIGRIQTNVMYLENHDKFCDKHVLSHVYEREGNKVEGLFGYLILQMGFLAMSCPLLSIL